VPEHISRKELKQDKIKETLEHGAEAVYSHSQVALAILVVILVVAIGYGGYTFYHDRQTAEASMALDTASKIYSSRIGTTPDPVDPTEPFFPDEATRAQSAAQKFTDVANKYPSTNPGRIASYYAALCLEDMEKHNQALEELKKISNSSDKELAAMAQFQIGVIYARTGKTDDAAKTFRALADKPSVLVPRPTVLLELAGTLRHSNPKEAAAVYEQIKKEFPDTQLSEEADRGLDTLSPKS
jgi:predicted negative regulator of RcsB-dependent stress response